MHVFDVYYLMFELWLLKVSILLYIVLCLKLIDTDTDTSLCLLSFVAIIHMFKFDESAVLIDQKGK